MSSARKLIFALVGGLLLASPVLAQEKYPSKPVTIVVAYPAGAVTDALGRLTANALQKELGVPFVIENRGGGAGVVGASYNANAAPDGYTLLFAASPPQTILPHFAEVTTFNPLKDYTPITKLYESIYVIVTNPNYKVNSVAELIADAKARPGQVKYASAGIGSGNHLATELFAQQTGVKLKHVPYSGGAPAITDLVNGTVDMMIITLPNVLGQVQGGKLRALAIASAKRSPHVPDVPTTVEAGLPNYSKTSWFALEGPPNLPANIVSTLNAALAKIERNPEFAKSADNLGANVTLSSPEELKALIEKEYTETKNLVEASKN